MKYICFNQNQKGDISTLKGGGSLKLADKFKYLRSSISSTKNDIYMQLAKTWRSDLFNKIKCNLFQATVMSILLYGCTTWMLTKCKQKKLDGNCTRILQAVMNKSWKQHPTKQLLYGHLPPITKTIQTWRTRYAWYCWRSDLFNKIKCNLFQATVMSILLYECTTWMLTKRMEKKLDGNCTRILQAVMNKSWKQHPTKQLLYGRLPPITKTIQTWRTRYAGYCWRSKDELISDVLLWIPSHG